MNPLSRWDAFKELNDLHHRVSALVGKSALNIEAGREENIRTTEWVPVVDISEDELEYLIAMDLAGVPKEDVRLTVESGVLGISGERKFEKPEQDCRYHRVELSYGTFQRNFTLPDGTDPAKVTAEFKDGVLKIHIAKTEKERPKTIEVRVL